MAQVVFFRRVGEGRGWGTVVGPGTKYDSFDLLKQRVKSKTKLSSVWIYYETDGEDGQVQQIGVNDDEQLEHALRDDQLDWLLVREAPVADKPA